MVIYLNTDGTAEKVTPQHVYQGSNNVIDITVIAPYPNTCAMEIGFILPNDLYWQAPSTEEGKYGGNYAPMESVTDYDTVSANAWNFVLPITVTQMPGKVGIAIKATTAHGERTSYLCEFIVEESVLPILPASAPEPSVYQLILQYLGRLNGRTANVPNLVAHIDKATGNSFTYTDNKGIVSAPITLGEIEYDPTYVNAASTIAIPKSAWQQNDNGSGYTAVITAGQHGQMVNGVSANDLWVSFDETVNGVITGDSASYTVETNGDITITVVEPVDMTVRVWNGKGLIDQIVRDGLQYEIERAKSAEAELQAEIDHIEQSGVDLTARTEIQAETARAINAEARLQSEISDINNVIPSTASAENQLADKAFVNSTVNNMSAFYITSSTQGNAFPTHAALIDATTFYSGGKARIPTQNDYATVLSDETQPKGVDGSYPTTRYVYQTNEVGGKYPDGQWDFQYVVNNTTLTQEQVDAINSGITKEIVDTIGQGTVTGVKGNSESSYRTGNVNITAENVGAVNKSGDAMTGGLRFNINGTTTTPTTIISNAAGWELPIIRFKANNAEGGYVCLVSKGSTVISSGESYEIFETNGDISSEDVCLISDYNVKIFTNLQNGWDNRHESRFLSSTGGLVLNVTNGSYNEGVRVNASASAYAGIYLGNDLNTYSGRDTTKGWMIARPNQEDGDGFPLLIAAQGNQSVDSKRVRITRDGDIYSRGSILYSANHMPPTPNLDNGTILYNTTSVSTGAKTLSESMGSFDLLVIVANWNGNQTCYTVPYYDFYDTSATSWLTVSTDSKYLNIYYRSSTSVYIIGFTSGISSVKIVGYKIKY